MTTKSGHTERKLGFFNYFKKRYLDYRSSIFIDGLVGGLFMGYIHDDGGQCDLEFYTDSFFALAISHFIQGVISNVLAYNDGVEEYTYKLRSPLQRTIGITLRAIQLAIRHFQYIILLFLWYLFVEIMVYQYRYRLTTDLDDPCRSSVLGRIQNEENVCLYCESNLVYLGMFTVSVQTVYGAMLMLVWLISYHFDNENNEEEKEEMRTWLEWEEKKLRGSFTGRLKNAIVVMGMEPFFGEGWSVTVLSITMALPRSNCKLFMLDWFLWVGVIYLLNKVLEDCSLRVFDLTKADRIINEAEFITILILKLLKFPVFLAELTIYVGIAREVFNQYYEVEHVDMLSVKFCKGSVWNLAVVIFWIYSVVVALRLFIFFTALLPPKCRREKQDKTT